VGSGNRPAKKVEAVIEIDEESKTELSEEEGIGRKRPVSAQISRLAGSRESKKLRE